MLVFVGLMVLAGAALGRLTGENVCREEQKFIVNVTEYVVRNTTVRHYKWCLNVPPRCSFYSTKLVNQSQVVEKEVSDFVAKCCSGYVEDKSSGRCTPVCPHCFNGTCVDGKCDCFPGYKGDRCEIGCDGTHWGRNCGQRCQCEHGGRCHPETGSCECAAGWTGNECESPCPPGFAGPNCRTPCNCPHNSLCDSTTGQCLSTPAPPTNIQFTNNGKFELDKTTLLDPTEAPFPLFGDEDKFTQMPANNHIAISRNETAKVRSGGDEENFLNDDARREDNNRNDLVSSASAATAISAGIIIVAGVIVAANHFKKNRGKKEEREKKGVSTVAVYTTSIFHTPLPEPPTFENPIFASPVETNPGGGGEGRIETHVVCSMNFPAPNKDPREFLYDHPPSTGSYRAASVPEPPDIEMSATNTHPEPLYDEIPSGTPVSQPPSYKSSLYMNTCGKTRF